MASCFFFASSSSFLAFFPSISASNSPFHGKLLGMPLKHSKKKVCQNAEPGSFLTRRFEPNFFASFFTRRLCSRMRFWMLYL